jgi:hypothetical protein
MRTRLFILKGLETQQGVTLKQLAVFQYPNLPQGFYWEAACLGLLDGEKKTKN